MGLDTFAVFWYKDTLVTHFENDVSALPNMILNIVEDFLESFELPIDIQEYFVSQDIQLCRGMYSYRQSAFRGKVYSERIESITGQTLYQETIEWKTVETMTYALERELESGISVFELELENLVKFFQVCRLYKLTLWNWW